MPDPNINPEKNCPGIENSKGNSIKIFIIKVDLVIGLLNQYVSISSDSKLESVPLRVLSLWKNLVSSVL